MHIDCARNFYPSHTSRYALVFPNLKDFSTKPNYQNPYELSLLRGGKTAGFPQNRERKQIGKEPAQECGNPPTFSTKGTNWDKYPSSGERRPRRRALAVLCLEILFSRQKTGFGRGAGVGVPCRLVPLSAAGSVSWKKRRVFHIRSASFPDPFAFNICGKTMQIFHNNRAVMNYQQSFPQYQCKTKNTRASDSYEERRISRPGCENPTAVFHRPERILPAISTPRTSLKPLTTTSNGCIMEVTKGG